MVPRKPPILVVDDDDDFRGSIVGILERSKFPSFAARSGTEAFNFIEQRRQLYGDAYVRLILSDWKMPDGDGIVLLNRLRATPNAGIPFVLMSGAVTRAELMEAAKWGPDAVLLKPFRVDKLFEIIETLTGPFAKPRGSRPPWNEVD